MMRAFDVELFFRSYPDFVGENFSPRQMWKYKNETKSWLNTLPINEYAYVLMAYTAHHNGGDPTQYVKILYNQMLLPVVASYLKQLAHYRFMRAVEMRKYFSWRKIAPAEGHVTMKTKFGMCTCKTKCLLRKICDDYRWLKDRPEDDPKVQNVIRVIKELTEICDEGLEKWSVIYDQKIIDAGVRIPDEPEPISEPND